jgi:hypothetical protein
MFKLSPETHAKYNKAKQNLEEKKKLFSEMSNKELANAANFWKQHCVTPSKFEEGDMIYDATMWHIIIPELIERLNRK